MGSLHREVGVPGVISGYPGLVCLYNMLKLVLLILSFVVVLAARPLETEDIPSPTLHSSPHHSLATLLYSVLVQDEAEDVDLSALPWGEEKSRVLLYIFLVTYFFEIKL